jgi:glycosyltransferase involved in cell wall biosynthesis
LEFLLLLNPRVLIIGNFLSQLGLSRGVCEELADKLIAVGWTVFATSRKKARFARLVDMLLTTWKYRHDYSVAQVDVFSGPAFFWAEAVCGLLRVLDKPFVLTLHGGNLPEFASQHPARIRRLLSSASCVTAPSGYLKKALGSFREDIHYIPNGIEIGRYPFHLRQSVKPKLVWLRAFHSIYNPVIAVEAITQLVGDFTDIELSMVGPDKGDGSRQQTMAEARRLGVEGRLTFPGGVPKSAVLAWLNKSDIFLNTTNVDNTPVSVIEAMSCGLCIVSTNVGGLPYLLKNEHDALLVPPNDSEVMAKAIRRVLMEPGLAERLSANARKKAEQFDWSIILPKWDKLLHDIYERSR